MSVGTSLDELVAGAAQVGNVRLVAAAVPGADREALAALADKIVEKLGDGVAVLGAETDGKVSLVCKVADSVVKRGAHAGNLIKAVAGACGGGGGGRPNFAQAGGTQPEKLQEALGVAAPTLQAMLR
jgi:alanyl-tRNA synthetase